MTDTKTVLVLPEDVGELEDLYWSSVRWIKKYGGREITLRRMPPTMETYGKEVWVEVDDDE